MERVSTLIMELEEWLGMTTYDYAIQKINVTHGSFVSCKVKVSEFDPDGEYHNYELTANENRKILNEDGDDIIELQKSYCNNDKEWFDKIREFEEEWLLVD